MGSFHGITDFARAGEPLSDFSTGSSMGKAQPVSRIFYFQDPSEPVLFGCHARHVVLFGCT
jgi:hypothetical protein